MPSVPCPRCGSESFKKLKTYCLECNYSARDLEPPDMIIPQWVINALSLSEEELNDIREINLGIYGPGYESVVKFPKHSDTINDEKPPLRNISLKRKAENIRARDTPIYQTQFNHVPQLSA